MSTASLEDALRTEEERDDRFRISPDEALWLSKQLETRSGKNVARFRIRTLLADDPDVKKGDATDSTGWRQKSKQAHRTRSPRCHRVSGLRAAERSGRASDGLEHEIDCAPQANWAVRRGTVGRWLRDVASPLVSFSS